jgi:hypothetical protein
MFSRHTVSARVATARVATARVATARVATARVATARVAEPPFPRRYTAVIDIVQKLGQALDISEQHQEILKFGDLSDPDVVDAAVVAAAALHRDTSLPPELEVLGDIDAVQMQLALYEELRVAVQDNLAGYISGVFKQLDAAKSLQRVKQSGKLQSFSAEYRPHHYSSKPLHKPHAAFGADTTPPSSTSRPSSASSSAHRRQPLTPGASRTSPPRSP